MSEGDAPGGTPSPSGGEDAPEKKKASDAKASSSAPEEKPAKKAYQPTGPQKPKPEGRKPESPPPGSVHRRTFVWTVVAGYLTLLVLGVMRFFFPRTLQEPPTTFNIGFPSDYDFGVSTKFKDQHRVWVVKGAEGIFVILAKCTHLGCTPDWKDGESKFKCPCHGSGFDPEGVNFEGPAPRPLERCHVALDTSGQIVVDKLRTYDHTEWETNRSGWLLT